MKNKKRYIIYAFFLLVIVIVIGGFSIKNIRNSKSSDEVYMLKVDDYIEQIRSEEIYYYEPEESKSIEDEINSIINNTKDSELIGKCQYVLGSINYIQFNYVVAVDYFDESLKNIEKNNPSLAAQIHYYRSQIYRTSEAFDKSQSEYEKAIEICEKYHLYDERVRISMLRSYDISIVNDDIEKSFDIMQEALEYAKEINYEKMDEVYFEIGISYWNTNRFVEATNYKLEAMAIALEKGHYKMVREISIDLGIDFVFLGNYSEAIRYLKMSFDYPLEDKYEEAESNAYSLLNLCDAYIKLEQYDEAKECFVQLEKIITQMRDGMSKEDTITYMYIYKADLETRLGNPNESLELLNIAKERFESKDAFIYLNCDIDLFIQFGNAYYALGDYELALENHKEAESLIEYEMAGYMEVIVNEYLYLDYKALNDAENTIKYLEKNNELKLKLINNQDVQYTQYLISKFEDTKNKEKILQLQVSQNRMKSFIVGLIVITIVILILSSFIYNKNKEINRLNKLFKDLSITDGLTKISNRRALDEYLSENWNRITVTTIDICIIMIDIDYFKKYNDNYGHPEGDKVLQSIAQCIKESSKSTDFVARYGGEEFMVICKDCNEAESIQIAEKIRSNLESLNIKHEYSKVSDRVTVSMGISSKLKDEDKSYEDVIKKADEALYEAKESGRNKYQFLR